MKLTRKFLLTSICLAVLGCKSAATKDGQESNTNSIARAGGSCGELKFDILQSQIEAYAQEHFDAGSQFDPAAINGHFSSAKSGGRAPELYASADFVYILHSTNLLKKMISEASAKEWIKVISSFQNSTTGYFKSDLFGHSDEHATGFASAALGLLGGKPRYNFAYSRELFASQASIKKWLDGFNWMYIWTGAHRIGAAAAVLTHPDLAPGLDSNWKQWLMSDLNSRVNISTGMWQTYDPSIAVRTRNTIALGGAAHFWWQYQCIGASTVVPTIVIDRIVEAQTDGGLWGSALLNGAIPQFIDIDAINGLRFAYSQLAKSEQAGVKKKIANSLEKFVCKANDMLNKPGSFEKYYGDGPHKLVGALTALAELDQLWMDMYGTRRLSTPQPWNTTIPKVCFL